tara:strand:- start:2595 stop:2945 length:351 start_codon:yes stop_codon:yes gene_type:complete
MTKAQLKEYDLQVMICKYLDSKDVLYCGSMGGQYQLYHSVRIKAKKTGYKSGFPDLFIYEPRGQYCGLAIELKVGYNKASKKQKDWIDQLNKRNYCAMVCNGWNETIKTIDKYLGL